MAMNKEGMASAIIEACKDKSKPVEAMDAFALAMKTYIEDNCEITFSWAGVLTPPFPAVPIPDPALSFKASISFADFVLTNPTGVDATTARAFFGTLIVPQLVAGLITPVDSAFIVACPPLLPMPMLLTPDSNLKTPIEAMKHFCGQVITVIKSMKNIIATPGTHVVPPPYIGTGTAVMTLIE